MTVTVYTHSLCPFSQKLEEYLHKNTILYTPVILDHQPEKLEEFKAANNGFNGVPFTVITKDDGTQATVRGFNEKELEQQLMGKPDAAVTDDKNAAHAQLTDVQSALPTAQPANMQTLSPEASQTPVSPVDPNAVPAPQPGMTDPSQVQAAPQAPYTPLDTQPVPEAIAPMSQQMSPFDENNQPPSQEPVQTFNADGSLMQPAPQIVT